MDAILTVRLDEEVKKRGAEILKQKGYSLSTAVQGFFDYVVKNESLPFEVEARPTKEEILSKVALLDSFHTHVPLSLDDDLLRAERLEERNGSLH